MLGVKQVDIVNLGCSFRMDWRHDFAIQVCHALRLPSPSASAWCLAMQLTLPLMVSLYYFWPFLASQCIALCFGDNNAHVKKFLLLVFTCNFSGDVKRLKLTEKRLRYHCRFLPTLALGKKPILGFFFLLSDSQGNAEQRHLAVFVTDERRVLTRVQIRHLGLQVHDAEWALGADGIP
jgi:hypothetical protein